MMIGAITDIHPYPAVIQVKSRRGGGDFTHHTQDVLESETELLLILVLGSAIGDVCGPLIGLKECKAQFRFPLAAPRIQTHERAANTPSEPRTGRGVQKRTPHHVSWNCEAHAADPNIECSRSGPQDTKKTQQQQQSLKQSYAKIRRKLGQAAGVFVNALVRIEADFARAGKSDRPARLQPFTKEIARQRFP